MLCNSLMGVLLVYDVTNYQSFENLEDYSMVKKVSEVRNFGPSLPWWAIKVSYKCMFICSKFICLSSGLSLKEMMFGDISSFFLEKLAFLVTS